MWWGEEVAVTLDFLRRRSLLSTMTMCAAALTGAAPLPPLRPAAVALQDGALNEYSLVDRMKRLALCGNAKEIDGAEEKQRLWKDGRETTDATCSYESSEERAAEAFVGLERLLRRAIYQYMNKSLTELYGILEDEAGQRNREGKGNYQSSGGDSERNQRVKQSVQTSGSVPMVAMPRFEIDHKDSSISSAPKGNGLTRRRMRDGGKEEKTRMNEDEVSCTDDNTRHGDGDGTQPLLSSQQSSPLRRGGHGRRRRNLSRLPFVLQREAALATIREKIRKKLD